MDATRTTGTIDNLGTYDVELQDGKGTVHLRRMSETELKLFIKQEFPWLFEHSRRLLRELDRPAYEKYCEVLVGAVLPLVADRNPKTGESPSAELIVGFAEDAMLYRFDAFNLLKAVLKAEGLDGEGNTLPKPEEVDGMDESEVKDVGEDSPPTRPAETTLHSGSPAATPSAGSESIADTPQPQSETSPGPS